MKRKRYVAGILFDQLNPGKILLIEKKKPDWQAGKYNFVGGKIEAGELPVFSMVRETLEEAGLVTKRTDWTLFVYMVGTDWEVFFFKATADLSKAVGQTDERLILTYIDRLWTLPVLPNLHWLVPLAMDKTVVFPIEIRDTVP